MASNSGIDTPTITADQWSQIQLAQSKAKAFLSAATGSAAKSNLTDFQNAFNTAFSAIVVAVGSAGGDPAAVKRLLGTTSISADGLWGPQTAVAMAIIIWASFPAGAWNAAAMELATANVINKKSGAVPISRNLIASQWYPKWKVQVNGMVWKDFAGAVIAAQKPAVTQNNENTVIKDAGSNQQNAKNEIAQTTTKTTTQEAIKSGEIVNVTGEAAGAKGFMWVWATLGLAAVGGGLWWMFGRKAR